MNYTPLHVHSDASADGAGTVQSLVAEAHRLGMKSLALTDHGTLANAVAFWSACQDYEIKPIFGIEAYLSYKGARHHLTLLSMNENGFNNLVALDCEAHNQGFDGGYPLVTLDSLERHRDSLVALTGCVASALYKGTDADGIGFLGDLIDTMGSKYQVLPEVMFIGTHNTWQRPLEYTKRFNLIPVVTNDSHYPCQHQFAAHQAITSARRGFTYDSSQLWLKSAAEIYHEGVKFTDAKTVERCLENTTRLSDLVTPFSLKSPPSLPYIPEVEEKLEYALKSALKEDVLLKGQRTVRVERLKREYAVLKAKGFLDYIFILWDIVSWAHAQGIAVGPGRGSGGGSYVLYLLGITRIDPIQHALLFERFINPARADYPDVDVDFESDRRGEVIEYASQKWNTIPIATYSCYSHKSAIHDIARVLKIPKALETAAAESTTDSAQFESFTAAHPDALDTYQTMLGQIRHRGKHAAGVIIPNRPVPVERAPNGDLVAAWAEGMNTKDLSKVGIVKYDLLGLTALSQLKRMAEITGIDYQAITWDFQDEKVYDLFCSGDVSGIFQWSGSEGIRDLTVRIAPRNFIDLTTCNALYRPGALDAGTAEQYPEFMKNPRKLHPRIDPILESTYGVICYQEQVMAIVAEVMGGDLAEADLARRLISKADVGNPKWEAEVELLKYNFIDKGFLQGFSMNLLDQLWHEIYTHSGYSYNLSHASAYTMISYWMAWYKVIDRPAYTTAVIQYDRDNAQTYILDAVESGLLVGMPNINYSKKEYTLNNNTIYLPLSDVAFLGEKAVDFVLEEREKNGLFESYADFNKRIPKRTCNNRARGMLERLGAFRGLSGDPADAIEKYDELELKGTYMTQLEILGYVVPSRELLEKMQRVAEQKAPKGQTAFSGFIKKITKKKSVHGEYTVFDLAPTGSFWMREPRPTLKVGVFVSGSKTRYGSSSNVKTYRLE